MLRERKGNNMIFDIIRNGMNIGTFISLMARVFVVFCVMPVHEYAHALVASKLGDDTARLSGRLTLSPFAHIDVLGALMIFFVGFGYAKPVPVNPRNFKNPKRGMALTALAGPVSNLLMAFLFLLPFYGIGMLASEESTMLYAIRLFFYYAASVNVGLAIFNFIPVPPLDGSRILNLVLPSKYYFKIMQYERYIVLAVFALLFFGVLDTPLNYAANAVMKLLGKLACLPFMLFN